MFQRWTKKVIDFLNRKKTAAEHVIIEVDKVSLTITFTYPNKQTIEQNINWREVKNIIVYKKDLYTFDQICMVIEVAPDRIIEIDETASGWEHLVTNITTYLPSTLALEKWFLDVAFPAFEINPIKIYSRSEKEIV